MVHVIISRHESTIQFLREYIKNKYEVSDSDIEVVDQLTDPATQIPFFSNVYGTLPLHLLLRLFRERGITEFYGVSLDLPKELRGVELGYEQLKKYISLVKLDHLDGEVITF